jgi:hypothetical protein
MVTDLIVSFDRVGIDVHVQIFATNSFVQVEQIVTIGFKVRSGIKGARDEALVNGTILDGLVSGGDAGKSLENGPQQLKTGGDILIGLALLDQGGNNSHVDARSSCLQGIAHAANKDIIDTADLRSRNDNLGGFRIVRVGDGVVQEADASNNESGGADLLWGEVGRVSDNHFGDSHLISSLDTVGGSVLHQNFIDILIEHKGSTVNGANSGESFWQTTKTVDGVDVRRCSVAREGVAVDLQFLDSRQCRLIHVFLIQLETHGVRNELMRIWNQSEFCVEFFHGHFGEIAAFVSLRLLLIILFNVHEELSEATLFKESHEWTPQSFFGSGRNLEDLSVPVDIGSSNGFKVEITSDLGVQQHFGQTSARHDELWDEIYVVITVSTQAGGRLTGLELFKQVGQVERSAITSIVSVSVELQHALSLDGEETGNHTLFQACAQDDSIVLSVRERLHALGKPIESGLLS